MRGEFSSFSREKHELPSGNLSICIFCSALAAGTTIEFTSSVSFGGIDDL